MDVSGKRVLVIGFGLLGSGLHAAALLTKKGAHVTANDIKEAKDLDPDTVTALEEMGITTRWGIPADSLVAGHDLIVASPAVPLSLPLCNYRERTCDTGGLRAGTGLIVLSPPHTRHHRHQRKNHHHHAHRGDAEDCGHPGDRGGQYRYTLLGAGGGDGPPGLGGYRGQQFSTGGNRHISPPDQCYPEYHSRSSGPARYF